MKKNLYTICVVLLLGVVMLAINACKEEFYTINDSYYDGMQIKLRNPLIPGDPFDTLRVEESNIDQIMIMEVSDPTLVFYPESFIYKLEDEELVDISPEGIIKPLFKGKTRLDITFRSNHALNTSVILEVYKKYQAVEEIQVPPEVSSTLIEIGESYDLAPMLIVLPVNADNKKLHFSVDKASEKYVDITDEGIITGKEKTSGLNRAIVYVVSDDNPEVTNSFKVRVVEEILIENVNVTAGLDGVEIGIGGTIDLNLCTSVSPSTVHPNNRKLKFELLEGESVLNLNEEGIVTAVALGTAKVKATSKNGKFAEFTIHVKEGLTDLFRLLWEVETSVSYGYVQDGTTGMPEHMFDNATTTYFSIAKPGKTINNCSTPAEHVPYFIVDMKSVQKFNYIRWNNRTSLSYDYLRVWGIDFAGSNDGEAFTDIATEIELDYKSDATQEIVIPESEFRYVKVTLSKWSDNSGGSTSGNTMQIAEFGLGYK